MSSQPERRRSSFGGKGALRVAPSGEEEGSVDVGTIQESKTLRRRSGLSPSATSSAGRGIITMDTEPDNNSTGRGSVGGGGARGLVGLPASSGVVRRRSIGGGGGEVSDGLAAAEEAKKRPWTKDDFEVAMALGKGKFGNVYLAREVLSREQVALKVLFKTAILTGGPQILINFRREVEIHTHLRHKYILRMYGYFHDAKNIYFILEFATGGELYKVLQKQGGFNDVRAACCTSQLALAIDFLHKHYVIHRDIKPENLLMDSNGAIKLTDFGWAIHAPPPHDIRTTLCGTPEYLSPEMVRASRCYDYSIDIWSLGVLCFELLTTKTPFADESFVDISGSGSGGGEGVGLDPLDPHAGVYQRIGNYNGHLKVPDTVSASARDLILGILQPEPRDRLSIVDILSHDWITAGVSADSSAGAG